MEQEDYFPPSNKIREIVCSAMKSMREAKQRKAQRPVVPQVVNEDMEDSDEDIFPDVGDYCPKGATEAAHIPEQSSKGYFKVTKSLLCCITLVSTRTGKLFYSWRFCAASKRAVD